MEFPNKYEILVKNSFQSGNYKLVPIRLEDRMKIMHWRNEQLYHLRQSKPLTEDDQNNYFNDVVSKLFAQKKPEQILFSYLENEKCIGYGGLVHINWNDRNAEISFIMDTNLEQTQFHKHWGIYLSLLEQAAFGEMDLHKIYTYAFDLRRHLYEAIEAKGYMREAELKEHCHINGEYKSVIIHSKINPGVSVRKATASDIVITFEWANDAETRINSFSSQPIPFDIHKNWFLSKLNSVNAEYYICEVNGYPAGIIRFDKETQTENYVTGINIAPTYRGRGLSDTFLRMACCEFFKTHSAIIDAYIKKENVASAKAFQKANFKYVGTVEIDETVSLKYQLTKNEG